MFLNRLWNSPGLWAIGSSSLRAGGGLITLPLALRYIPQAELGLHYTFLGLAVLGLILDMGFGQTLSRFAAFAWAGAESLKAKGVPEYHRRGEPNLNLLRRLVAGVRLLYRGIALAALVLLILPGGWFIQREIAQAGLHPSLNLCWMATALGVSLELGSGFWRTVLFGAGGMREAHRVSVASNLVSIVTLASCLLAGLGIWSFAVSRFLMAFTQWQLAQRIFYRHSNIRRLSLTETGGLELVRTMWPMAWRQGLVSFGSFLTLRANTVICTILFGLKTTASYGLTLQVLSVIGAVTLAPTAVLVPRLSELRVHGDSPAIVRLFGTRLYPGLAALAALGALAIWAGPWFLKLVGSQTELLSPGLMLALLGILILELHHTSWGWLVLTENDNPLVLPILLSGILIAVCALILGTMFSLPGMIAAQGLVQLAFNNWWIVWRGFKGLKLPFSQFVRCLGQALQHPLSAVRA